MSLLDLYRAARKTTTGLLIVTCSMLAACGNPDATQAPAQTAPAEQTPAAGAASTNNADPSVKTSEADTTQAAESAIATSEPVDPVEPIGPEDGPEPVSATTSPTLPSLRLATAATPETKAAPSSFKEGVHYQRLVPAQPTGVSPGQVEVVEVFWYGCEHCFALDPKLENWRKKDKPGYVVFRRVPATWNDVTVFHGRVFYAAELLGQLDDLHEQIFREIHLNGNTLNSMDKTKAFFTSKGVKRAEFDRVFASSALESKLQNATLLNKRYRVRGVPFFVINGKFTADVATAGSEERLLQLLGELAAREHGG